MNLIDPIIQELTHEAATTRRLLERIPTETFGFKPHEKSMSMAELACHIADALGWTATTIDLDVFEMDVSDYKPFKAENTEDLLQGFDRNVAASLDKLRGVPNDRLMQPWQMKVGGQVVIEMPRIAVLRTFILNHLIHHRGQLSVYLRMKDVPLPQIYGPTADETGMMQPA
jgi:uncharacterized damage-inducible protein DinB